ncbi:asparagine synthase-related protein, partial [Planktotalea sp.]|uniref:asparagine synthase-related protein n=1 Tax=Planktotalea sp. TaxID=2029877 RepID=UPI003298BBCB
KFVAKAAFNAAFSEKSRVRQLMKAPFGKASPVVSDLMTGLKHRSGAVSSLSENRTSNTIANRVNAITNPVLALRIEVLACHGLRSGVRYVHPLLDQDLIDFALTCPPEYEFRDGLFRAPVRAAMNGILPDAARLRAQTGYPFVEAVLDIASMQQELIDKLAELETDARLHDVFDFDFVRAHLEKLPSFEAAHQHVLDVSSSGKKQAPPLNVSFAAVGAMMTYQAALDEEAAQAHSG